MKGEEPRPGVTSKPLPIFAVVVRSDALPSLALSSIAIATVSTSPTRVARTSRNRLARSSSHSDCGLERGAAGKP